MKKIAAMLICSGPFVAAMAQSSVTLFGTVDTAILYISYDGHGSATTLGSFGNSPSRLGFLGTEDLGGGLKAIFRLETSFTPNNGDSPQQAFGLPFFNRSAWVGLENQWGTVHLGRDWNAVYLNTYPFDPTGNLGVTNLNHILNLPSRGIVPNYYWNSNAVTYYTPPTLGGVYAVMQASVRGDGKGCGGNVTCSTTVGSYVGGRIGYANGPLEISAAIGQTGITSNAVFPAQSGKWTQANIGMIYDFKVAKLSLWFNTDRFISAYENAATIAVTVPIGTDYAFASAGASRTNSAAQAAGLYGSHSFGVGYGHPLSKRTTLYVATAYLKNGGLGTRSVEDVGSFTDNTLPGRSTLGFEVGMSHKF